MIPESLKQQIDQWLDDDLTEEEQVRLQRVLESTPEALDFLCDRALLHQMLFKSDGSNPLYAYAQIDKPAIAVNSENLSTPPIFRLGHPWMWASSATVVCLLLISLFLLPEVIANPAEIVQRTLKTFQTEIDRCYSVKVDAEVPLRRNRFLRRATPSDSKLWVRGSQFVQMYEDVDEPIVWGRNERGAVWFTVSGETVAVFEANEIPDVLQELCDLRCLQLPDLLESLLRDYDLDFDHEKTDQEKDLQRISARPRASARNLKYGDVEVEIESQSLLVRRVTMERRTDKRPVAVVSFSLSEVQPQSDSTYEFESYLQPNAEVFDRGSIRGKRSELLRDFLQELRVPLAIKNEAQR